MVNRRNGLTGSGDPRFPHSAVSLVPLLANSDGTLRTQLYISSTLDNFLKKIFFEHQKLMTHIVDLDTLIQGIYEVYSDTGGKNVELEVLSAINETRIGRERMIRELPKDVVFRAFYQYADIDLLELDPTVFLKKSSVVDIGGLIQDFVYFPIDDTVMLDYRVYLNISYEFRIKAVEIVSAKSFEYYSQVNAIKTAGPYINRADNVVIYCSGKEVANKIALLMTECIKKGILRSSNQTIPAMTKWVGPGVSIGAQPIEQENGKSRSFGKFRSQIIAAAILSYRRYTATHNSDYLIFRQYVAHAFKDHGLDPANPED